MQGRIERALPASSAGRRRMSGTRGVSQVELPYPSAGIGGGRLLKSPSEGHVVLSLYSGQSEEGYEVFAQSDASDAPASPAIASTR